MALSETKSGRRHVGGALAQWPQLVSAGGGWLRQQAQAGGVRGLAATAAVTLVSRSAELAGEVSAEVLKATRPETPGAKARARRPHRRGETKAAPAEHPRET